MRKTFAVKIQTKSIVKMQTNFVVKMRKDFCRADAEEFCREDTEDFCRQDAKEFCREDTEGFYREDADFFAKIQKTFVVKIRKTFVVEMWMILVRLIVSAMDEAQAFQGNKSAAIEVIQKSCTPIFFLRGPSLERHLRELSKVRLLPKEERGPHKMVNIERLGSLKARSLFAMMTMLHWRTGLW